MNSDQKRPGPEPLVYTIDDAATVLRISTKSVRRLIKRNLLSGSKALRKILIPRKQVENFLKSTCDDPEELQ